MATLETYLDKLSRKISTSSTNFFEEADRISAINDAIIEFCDAYQIDDLKKKVELDFEENGDGFWVAEIPTDLSSPLHITRLWNKTDNIIYTFLSPDQFFNQTTGNYWTYDYSLDDEAMRIFLYEKTEDPYTLELHYRSTPATLEDFEDESGLPDRVTEIIAILAGVKLMAEAQDNDHLVRLEKMLKDAVGRWKGVNTTVSKRLVSVYEQDNYYNRR